MPGCHITDRQVRRYMASRKAGYTQAASAARAGFSDSTARRVERAPVLPSQRPPRQYRTRVDPFQHVWRTEIVPLLERAPGIRATTVLEELQRLHPGHYPDTVLRSLQRRIAQWRATEGPERELVFRQEHPPGRQALSDFTHADTFTVTIAGQPFEHMLYHFWLAFSGWEHVRAIQGGESFTALTEGLQDALWQLGGVPREHRTDRLSAAYRNLTDREDEAKGYAEFCKHYGLEPTRNNPGAAHENGSVEAAHGHLKRTIREALELRGSNDFADPAAYQAFLHETIARKNAKRAAAVAIELKALQPLPRHRTTDFLVATVTVTRFGTISLRGVLYTVPSRLIGSRLKVHLFDNRIVCHLGATPVLTLPRRYRRAGDKAVRQVDYRHLIASLVKKPQAFRHSVFREHLFPREAYRRAWEALDARLEPRKACRVYVGLLHLAAMHGCEARLAEHLEAVLDQGGLPDLEAARAAVAPVPAALPTVAIPAPDPAAYDGLLVGRVSWESPS
jgi:transposase InsO family protein